MGVIVGDHLCLLFASMSLIISKVKNSCLRIVVVGNIDFSADLSHPSSSSEEGSDLHARLLPRPDTVWPSVEQIRKV